MTEMTMFHPGDPGFDPAGFQTAYTHRPSVLVAAADAGEVRAAVRHAAAHGLPVAVQATGHGLTTALDGGVLITTGRMPGVEVDPAARTARVQAGTTWDAVVDAAGKHGLAPLSGSAPGVGVVGYTLGGGLGLLSRRYGWAADHVRGIDVVTPDGASHHLVPGDELFTALRGDGRDRAVVTGMEIGLVPVERIYGGGLYFAAEHVPAVLRAYLEWTRDLPDAMTSSVALIPFPDVEGMPPPLRGRYLAHVRVVFAGDADEGERLVAPLRAVAPRVIDTLDDMPFTDSAAIYDDPPWPHAYSGTNALLRDLEAAALPSLVDIAGPRAPMMCVVQLNHLGGALARPGG
jgi:FAD/FMN-containing dehydrogenase